MGGTSGRSGAWAEVVSHDARFEFPDVIGFSDGGSGGVCWRGGPWAAEGRLHRVAFLSKPNGARRRMAVLDPAVHARYRDAVADVAAVVERSLGHEVIGSRCLATGTRLTVEPWRPARRRYVRRVASWRCGAVVRLDVRNCFGSMSSEVVTEALARAGADRSAAVAVRDLLCAFEADGIPGLPVGPEPSAVLANAVLASADRAMRSLGVPFARWSDDVAVGAIEGDSGAVAEAWTGALEPLGLRPAHDKTRVHADVPEDPLSGWHGRAAGSSSPVHRAMGREHASEACERAVAVLGGPDPHRAREAVAGLGLAGGRDGRAILRNVRIRFPYLAATAEWGLSR